jgi:hypothetical protein
MISGQGKKSKKGKGPQNFFPILPYIGILKRNVIS